MIKRRSVLGQLGSSIIWSGLVLAACTPDRSGSSSLNQASPITTTMKLESSAFKADSTIPAKYTCDGDDRSPALSWDEPPEGTRSFALIMDDPDAPGRTFVHWVLYDLPADIRQLPEAVATDPLLVTGGVQGKNDFDRYGYGGPCPPGGSHRYVFKLYALDTILDLPPGANKEQVIAAMDGHILAGAELVGLYSR
ncbi:MAG: YbhB/YbcL family Raf kinase inhibitor-like protein [Elainellaceae cyanobacterium]